MNKDHELREFERSLRADPENRGLPRKYEQLLARSDLNPLSTIMLRSGRSIHLINLCQDYVHDGYLEGYPNAPHNLRTIENLRATPADCPTILIEPRYRNLEELKKQDPEYFEQRKPQLLPAVSCLAIFKSDETVDISQYGFSILRILWFQESYAFPIEESVIRKLLDIDWDAHAVDGDY